MHNPLTPGQSEREAASDGRAHIRAIVRRAGRQSRRLQKKFGRIRVSELFVDHACVNTEARRARDGEPESRCRDRVVIHHRNLARDRMNGLYEASAQAVSDLEEAREELDEAARAERAVLARTRKHDRVPAKGAPWSGLSVFTAVMLLGATVFLMYSSLTVVESLLKDLGRAQSTGTALVVAPLTVLGPFGLFVIGLMFERERARPLYAIVLGTVGTLCLAAWILVFPEADPASAFGGGGGWGSSEPAEGGWSAYRWMLTTQLGFDVATAAACKIALHQLWSTHLSERLVTTKNWSDCASGIELLRVGRHAVDLALLEVTAMREKMSGRIAANGQSSAMAFEDRLRRLKSDLADFRDMDSAPHGRNDDRSPSPDADEGDEQPGDGEQDPDGDADER